MTYDIIVQCSIRPAAALGSLPSSTRAIQLVGMLHALATPSSGPCDKQKSFYFFPIWPTVHVGVLTAWCVAFLPVARA